MPTTITGDPSTVSNTLTRTVTAASNASPIVITTSASHLFGNGDTVIVSGVLGNTAANGTFKITKISATTFSLNGSTGSGAYTSGGSVVDASLTPQFQIPSDGDAENGASVNAALEALADRTQYLALIARMQSKTFLASGSWTAPADCQVFGLVVGCGGGGAGGGGKSANTTTDSLHGSGGGGGGAIGAVIPVQWTAGATYDVTVGAGGASGGAASATGGDGGDSIVALSGSPVATCKGAGGAAATVSAAVAGTSYIVSLGGSPVASGVSPGTASQPAATATFLPLCPSNGGCGVTSQHTLVGAQACRQGQASAAAGATGAGGAAGAYGTDSSTYRGGAGGGGGGAGPYGNGGAGGTPGNGNNAGAGTAGGAGANAAANTGAGGGGGGSGGAGSTSGGAGGIGGNGGSGRITIYYFGSPS